MHHSIIQCIIIIINRKKQMWLQIFGTYWLIISLLGLFLLNRVFAKFSKRTTFQDTNSQYFGHVRSDFGKWPYAKMYLGAIIYLPFKCMILLQYVFGAIILLSLTQLLPSNLRAKIMRIFTSFQMFMIGMVFRIREHEPIQKVKTPIIIANHTCWFDIFYLVSRCWPTSFISKASIKKLPVVGAIATYIKCIFVNRQKASGRQNTLALIKERIDGFYEQKNEEKQEMSEAFPLIIFPEGTTSNGKVIIKFKSGAFDNLSPLTVMCLHYSCDDFDMGMDEINQAQHTLLTLCLRPQLQVKHFDIKPLQNEKPEEYMQRCKQEMAKVLGYPMSETGYRQKVQLKEIVTKKKSE